MGLSSFPSQTCCLERSVWLDQERSPRLLLDRISVKKLSRNKSACLQTILQVNLSLTFFFSPFSFFFFFPPQSSFGHSEMLHPDELVTSPTPCNCSNCHVRLTRKSALQCFLAVVHRAALTRIPSVRLSLFLSSWVFCSCVFVFFFVLFLIELVEIDTPEGVWID